MVNDIKNPRNPFITNWPICVKTWSPFSWQFVRKRSESSSRSNCINLLLIFSSSFNKSHVYHHYNKMQINVMLPWSNIDNSMIYTARQVFHKGWKVFRERAHMIHLPGENRSITIYIIYIYLYYWVLKHQKKKKIPNCSVFIVVHKLKTYCHHYILVTQYIFYKITCWTSFASFSCPSNCSNNIFPIRVLLYRVAHILTSKQMDIVIPRNTLE